MCLMWNLTMMKLFKFNMRYLKIYMLFSGLLLLNSCHGEEPNWCLNDIKSLIARELSSPCLIAGLNIKNSEELHVSIRNIDVARKPTGGGFSIVLKYADNKWAVSDVKSHNYPPDDERYKGIFLDDKENNWCLSGIHKILKEKKLEYLRILSITIMTPKKLHILITNMKEDKPLGGTGQWIILEYKSGKWSIERMGLWTS